jgi:hypothetical protein
MGAVAALLPVAMMVHGTAAGASNAGQKGSGGPAVAHHAGGAPIRSSSVTSNAPDARYFSIGMNASEPTMGLTKDGAAFVTAFQGNTKIEVVKSTNGGSKWETVSPKVATHNAQVISLDPYLYVDRDTGRVFTIDNTVACLYLSYSDDEGKSWTTNPFMCGHPDVNDHQTVFTGPPVSSPTVGYPKIVYFCYNDVVTTSCEKSLDGGINWTQTGSPAFPGYKQGESTGADGVPGLCGGLSGHGYVGYDGTVFLPRGWCGQPYVAISHDEGVTWQDVRVAKNGIAGHEASVGTDKKGNIYYDYIGGDRLPYMVVSRNDGKTWSQPMEIGPPGLKEADLPSLEVGGVGKVAQAYMGSTNSPGAPWKSSKYQKTTWNGYMTETTNALDKNPVFYTASVNNPKDPMVRGTCGPDRCLPVYDFIDVAIDPNGGVWGSFVDGCTAFCVTTPTSANNASLGVVGRLVGGPSLK